MSGAYPKVHIVTIAGKQLMSPFSLDWVLVLVDREGKLVHHTNDKERLMVLSLDHMDKASVLYVDLVAAMDVLVCKTGYGIVAEAIMHGISGETVALVLT
jgi:hypothetical protein